MECADRTKRAPRQIVDKVSAALAEPMKDPGVQTPFKTNGHVLVNMTPASSIPNSPSGPTLSGNPA